MIKPIYPDISVQINLAGPDGNAYVILSMVIAKMSSKGIDRIEIDKFYAEATSGNYGNLLRTCEKYVNCDFFREERL